MAVVGTAAAADYPAWGRLSGADRYATAVAISRASFPQTAPEVVVATGADFPDGLVGGALAVAGGGPILLVSPDSVPDPVAAELDRLAPQRILVLGGRNSIGDAVVAALGGSGASVQRVAGLDRYGTAADAAARFPSGVGTVVVASGEAFPDAMVGASAAGAAGGPVLLTQSTSLPAVTQEQLARLAPRRILLIGGTNAASTQVEAALGRFAPVVRLAGPDRFATAAAVAQATFPQAPAALVATGATFADSLAAAPLTVRVGQPVLLSPGTCAAAPMVDFLRARGWPSLTLVGGAAALSSAVGRLVPCMTPPDGPYAPGVDLRTLPRPGPNVVKVLTIDRRQGATVRSVLPTGRVGGRDTVSATARRLGAVAAVNGDFFLPDGRPVHAFATGGRLLSYPGLYQNQFGIDERDPTRAYTGFAAWKVTARIEETGAEATIDRVNTGLPQGAELAVITPEAGGQGSVPADFCSAVLVAESAPGLGPSAEAEQHQVVDRAGCGLGTLPGDRDVVVAHPGTPAGDFLATAQPGQHLVISWLMRSDWPGVLDTTGGAPVLVEGGQLTAEMRDQRGGAYEEVAPRTAVGMLPDGRLLLVTVDGRQPGYSVGLRLRDFAQVFVDLGAVWALNLDGGGSTAMSVGGLLANRPSDAAGERPVGTALLVFSGPAPAALVPAAEAASVRTSAPFVDPVQDPGSLGGLLDRLDSSGYVPDPLRPLVDER